MRARVCSAGKMGRARGPTPSQANPMKRHSQHALIFVISAFVFGGVAFFWSAQTRRVAAPDTLASGRSVTRLSVKPRKVVRAAQNPLSTKPVGEVQPARNLNLRFHPRAREEWQGMPIDLSVRAPCEPAVGCQLSLACREDGFCGPCRTSADCMGSEVCAVDHCLLRASTDCSRRSDCPEGEMCILVRWGSDAFSDVRGNTFLRSSCTSKGLGPTHEQPRAEIVPPTGPIVPAALAVESDVSDLSAAFVKGREQ